MKKLTSMLLALALVLSLAACGGAASSSVASSAASSEAVPEAASEAASSEEAKELSTTDALRIAGLKGPTTMGLVNLLSMEEDGTASMDYDLQLYGAADEIVPLLMKGELDMAAIPANLAATLYQKTEGGIQAVAVNTLGVLYVVDDGMSHGFPAAVQCFQLPAGHPVRVSLLLRCLQQPSVLSFSAAQPSVLRWMHRSYR